VQVHIFAFFIPRYLRIIILHKVTPRKV